MPIYEHAQGSSPLQDDLFGTTRAPRWSPESSIMDSHSAEMTMGALRKMCDKAEEEIALMSRS